LIEAVESQSDKSRIQLAPELGEFYLQLVGLAYDIAMQLDWENDKLLRKFVKTCQLQFDNLK